MQLDAGTIRKAKHFYENKPEHQYFLAYFEK